MQDSAGSTVTTSSGPASGELATITDHSFEPGPSYAPDRCGFRGPPDDDSDFKLCGRPRADHPEDCLCLHAIRQTPGRRTVHDRRCKLYRFEAVSPTDPLPDAAQQIVDRYDAERGPGAAAARSARSEADRLARERLYRDATEIPPVSATREEAEAALAARRDLNGRYDHPYRASGSGGCAEPIIGRWKCGGLLSDHPTETLVVPVEAEVEMWIASAFPDAPHGIREAARWGYDNGRRRGLASTPDDLRAKGWTVAAHNDYRLGQKSYTFWLVTNKTTGRFLIGEGDTDAEALDRIRRQIRETERSEAL